MFYTFIASLRHTIISDIKGTTATHKFIRSLRDKRKLVRCYTQNIDGLEARENLCSDLERGKGNRGRFTKKSIQVVGGKHHRMPGGCLDGGCEVVQLHGDLDVLRCTLCSKASSWADERREAIFFAGKAPVCQNCALEDRDRRDRGKRGMTIGTCKYSLASSELTDSLLVRPNIVLYGEEHPKNELISPIVTHDLGLAPDVLLILGTSLKVHGLKNIVKEFSRSIHARKNGKVIFVNLGQPAESTWKEVIDYWVNMDCDSWVQDVQRRRADIFLEQKSLNWNIAKVNVEGAAEKRKGWQFEDDNSDKENNAFPESTSSKKSANQIHGRSVIQETRKLPQTPQRNRFTRVLKERQLPTPPPTRYRSIGTNSARPGSLVQHGSETPSKRRKLEGITICCDSEDDENSTTYSTNNCNEDSILGSIIVAVPTYKGHTTSPLKRKRTVQAT